MNQLDPFGQKTLYCIKLQPNSLDSILPLLLLKGKMGWHSEAAHEHGSSRMQAYCVVRGVLGWLPLDS